MELTSCAEILTVTCRLIYLEVALGIRVKLSQKTGIGDDGLPLLYYSSLSD